MLRRLVFFLLYLTFLNLLMLFTPYLPAINLAPTFQVPISGTGSMYPTIPKGIGKTDQLRAAEVVDSIPMYRFWATPSALTNLVSKHTLSHGDIVDFENPQVDEISQKQYGRSSGFVKRVIALPGDTIEIRDGLVLLNNQPQKESYTALPHSTFGGEFLPDCQPLTIPSDSVFVMGDNRKGSNDSRHELGLIKITDISHVLPYSEQAKIFSSRWRDSTNDLDSSTKITLDSKKYLDLVNTKRQASGIKPLVLNSKLTQSAKLRAEIMLKTSDFSFEATRSGLTQEKSFTKVGYWNPVWGESWQIGYYTAEELLENQLEFPESSKFLLDPQFTEIGISPIAGLLNNCPTQIIVSHLAGYIPPNYPKDITSSWQTGLANLKAIQPGWASLKQTGDFYDKHRQQVDRLNELISIRISRMEAIVSRLTKNQWLTSDEKYWMEQDTILGNEQNSLANSINSF